MRRSAFFLAICLAASQPCLPVAAQEDAAGDLVKKLQGQAGKPRTRSLTAPPAVKPMTRKVTVAARGVPQAVQVKGVAGTVRVRPVETTAAAAKPSPEPTPADTAKAKAKAADTEVVEISYEVDPESQVVRQTILFGPDSTDFADAAAAATEIRLLAKVFRDPLLAGGRFVIEGHSSADGEADRNQRLSQARAEAIVARLAALGVDTGKLIPIGFGESMAKHPETAGEPMRAQDRRVEIFRLSDP